MGAVPIFFNALFATRTKNGRCPYFFFAGAAARAGRQRAIQGFPNLPDKIVAAAGTAALRRLDDGFRGLRVRIRAKISPPVPDRLPQEAPRRQDRIVAAPDMRPRARPGIILRNRHHAAPHRVHLHVAHRRVQVPLVQDARKEAPLPQVARRVALAVEILGVEHVDGVEEPGQRLLPAGNGDQVDVIRHQAVGPDVEAVPGAEVGEQLQVSVVIARIGEDGLPVISPLRDVVGITNRNGSGYSRHRRSPCFWGVGGLRGRPHLIKNGRCPYFFPPCFWGGFRDAPG